MLYYRPLLCAISIYALKCPKSRLCLLHFITVRLGVQRSVILLRLDRRADMYRLNLPVHGAHTWAILNIKYI